MNVMIIREIKFTIAQNVIKIDLSKLAFTTGTINNLSV